VGKPTGRITQFNVNLLHQNTTLIVEFSMPNKLARHYQGLIWLVSAFDWVKSFAFYCPLNIENNLKECDDPPEGQDAAQG
jgi:hypothetical protein